MNFRPNTCDPPLVTIDDIEAIFLSDGRLDVGGIGGGDLSESTFWLELARVPRSLMAEPDGAGWESGLMRSACGWPKVGTWGSVIAKQERAFPSSNGINQRAFCSSVPYRTRSSMFPMSGAEQLKIWKGKKTQRWFPYHIQNFQFPRSMNQGSFQHTCPLTPLWKSFLSPRMQRPKTLWVQQLRVPNLNHRACWERRRLELVDCGSTEASQAVLTREDAHSLLLSCSGSSPLSAVSSLIRSLSLCQSSWIQCCCREPCQPRKLAELSGGFGFPPRLRKTVKKLPQGHTETCPWPHTNVHTPHWSALLHISSQDQFPGVGKRSKVLRPWLSPVTAKRNQGSTQSGCHAVLAHGK